MFEQFEAGHNVERAGVRSGEILGGGVDVLNLLPAFVKVQSRHTERLVGEVDAGHVRTACRHALREYAATAADVEHALAAQADIAIDVVEAQGLISCSGLNSIRDPTSGVRGR